ncbi:MAG: hypothetical protein Q9213_002862 [Squamulea squamosa]
MPSFLHRSKKGKKALAADGNNSSHQADAEDPQELYLRATDGQGLWQQAWRVVKNEVDWELPESLQNAENLSTKEEVNALQQEATDRRNVAENDQCHIFGTRYTYREVCDKVSSYAKQFQFVGDIVTQAEPVYAALPWTAIRFVINCAVGESETYHTILDGTQCISGLVVQYPAIEQIYAKIDSPPGNELRKSLLHLYKLILRFQLYSIKYFDPKRKIARAFTGLNAVKAETIKSQLAAIDKAKQKADSDISLVAAEVSKAGIDNILAGHVDQKDQLEAIKSILRALSSDAISMVKEQREWTSEADKEQQARNEAFVEIWKAPLDDLKQRLEEERIQSEKEYLYNVRRWLSRAEPERDYAEAKGKRLMHLGEWLIEHREFLNWQSSAPSSLLWLHGFAGTGKTGLVCRVLQELRTKLENADLTKELGRLAFFYCSSDRPSTGREVASRADPSEALRSIVSQLSTSQQGQSVASIIQEKYDACGPDSDNRRPLNDAECVETILEVAKIMPITIVLDAFDELDQQKSPQCIQHLREVIRQSPESVKIFISTRSFPAIEDYLRAGMSIEVTTENNGGDVKTFIRRMLQASIDERLLLNGDVSEGLQSDIERTLTKRSQNMFLYASLLLTQLCDRNKTDDEESIREKLEGLPKDVTEAYNTIMVEVHDDKGNSERSCHVAQETFKWLLHSQETLGHDAFLEAVSPPEKKVNHEELVRACRTLVVRGQKTYEPAHYSVREHLARLEDYTASKCHIVATRSCLRILNKMFGSDKVHHDLLPSEKEFGEYALLYWPFHYESINQTDLSEHRSMFNAMIRTFLLQGRSKLNKYESWFTQASEKAETSKHSGTLVAKFAALKASPLTPLFAAAVFGLEDLVSKFGREIDQLNKCNEHGQTALCLAIQHNKLAVVKALLNGRFPAEINLLNVHAVQQFEDWNELNKPNVILYASALQCAAANGMLEIATYLIQEGAHVDLVAGYYGSPLQAAACNGHASIVELLLSHKAEPNSQGGFYGNALQAAAAKGHLEIINLLLENKPPAIVSAPGGPYGSALMAAICSGSSDTTFTLLEEKANPNLRSKVHGIPLEKAADMGHAGKEIVKDLLEFKAEADLSPKGKDVHILHKAAIYGMEELASYCLDKGCSINMTTVKGSRRAEKLGRSTRKRLRDRPSFSAPRYERRFGEFPREMTPLAYACAEGNLGMVRLLLKRGACLEREQDPSAVLWISAYQGHPEVVDILINTFRQSHNFEATARFIDQRPSRKSDHPILWAACSAPSPETVRVLLDQGVKYKSDRYRATPLFAAATFARPNVAKTLLDYHRQGKIDVCINQRANNGRTALYEACESKSQRVLEQLLDAGADYTIRDEQDCTPLHAGIHHDGIGVLATLYKKAWDMNDTLALDRFINARASTGQTALFHAVKQKKLAHVDFLLGCGADYTISEHAGNNPLHRACQDGNEQICKKLIDHAQQKSENKPFQEFLNLRNDEGCTALYLAVYKQRVSVVQLLLREGADHTIANNDNTTPLHVAAWRGCEGIVVLLLQKSFQELDPAQYRAFINRRNVEGVTALMDSVASQRKQPNNDSTKILLDYEADLTIPQIDNLTPLQFACTEGLLNMVQLLLDHAQRKLSPSRCIALLNNRDDKGKTPLWDIIETARGNPEVEIVRLLLNLGADYMMPNTDGDTPLHIAAYHGHVNFVQMLLEYSSKDGPERFKSFINAHNDEGETALHRNCTNERPKVTRLLMDHGIDFTISDNNGHNALHRCKAFDNIKTMQVLLEKASARETAGGDAQRSAAFNRFINQADEGYSVLYYACLEDNNEMVSLLLEYGADSRGCDRRNRTLLYLAIRSGYKQLAILLLEHASAEGMDEQELRQLLSVKRGRKLETAKETAIKKGMGEVVKMIEGLEKRLNISDVEEQKEEEEKSFNIPDVEEKKEDEGESFNMSDVEEKRGRRKREDILKSDCTWWR